MRQVQFVGENLEAYLYLEPPALELSNALGMPVVLVNWHGHQRALDEFIEEGVFYIFFWAKPSLTSYSDDSAPSSVKEAFGFSTAAGQRDAVAYTGNELPGIDICDPGTDEILARRIDNKLYVRFDLPHSKTKDTEEIFRCLVAEFLKPTQRTLSAIAINQMIAETKKRLESTAQSETQQIERLQQEIATYNINRERDIALSTICLDVTEDTLRAAILQLKEHRGVYKVVTRFQNLVIETQPVYIEHEAVVYKLGRITFSLSWRTPFLRFTHKTTSGPLVHPHVNNDGRACMDADMAHWIACALMRLDLVLVMDAIWTFLHTYSLGNAHSIIENWTEVEK